MKVAFLVPDNRENFRRYELPEPYFGTAPGALLDGFAMLADHPDAPEIHVISCTQKRIPAPGKLASNIWFHSLRVPKSGWLRSGYQGCVRAVRNKLREINPDIVHAQGTERDCAISAALSPYPRILTIHGNLRLIRKQLGFRLFSAMWFQSHLEEFVIPRFDGVVCISNYTREEVKHEVSRTWVVPNAVDPKFLVLGEEKLRKINEIHALAISNSGFKSQASGSDSTPIILCVANIDPRKNQNGFIRALDALVSSMNFEVRFFGSCGESDYAREFNELIASRPWCHYGGMIGREELRHEFEQAAMLALPTHEDNCPMVVLEAMAAGVPVMASKVGGIPDLIDGVRTGLFCEPSIPTTFCEAVSRLLADSWLASDIGRSASQEAIKRFHPKVIAARHLEIYHEVLGK